MAELSLRERLQPALLDRLVDDERLLTIYDIAVDRGELKRLGVALRDLVEIIAGQGLTPVEIHEDTGRLRFRAPNGRVGLSRLRSLTLKPPGAPQGVALQSFCELDAHNVVNDSPEDAERRHLAPRRLREYVCRDLAILLNSTSLEASYDLSALAHVRRSVLNYGMPPLAGRSRPSLDLRQIARVIEETIRQFEPRLVQVRVVPDTERGAVDEHEISFRIDAELWGQPLPQHLVLRTRISTESGHATVNDSGAG